MIDVLKDEALYLELSIKHPELFDHFHMFNTSQKTKYGINYRRLLNLWIFPTSDEFGWFEHNDIRYKIVAVYKEKYTGLNVNRFTELVFIAPDNFLRWSTLNNFNPMKMKGKTLKSIRVTENPERSYELHEEVAGH